MSIGTDSVSWLKSVLKPYLKDVRPYMDRAWPKGTRLANAVESIPPETLRQIIEELHTVVEPLHRTVTENLEEEDIERLLLFLLHLLANIALSDHERGLKLFDTGQAMGVHFLRSHFYSVVPNTSELPPGFFDQRFDDTPGVVDLRHDEQLSLLKRLSAYSHELDDTLAVAEPPARFGWDNPAFYPYDGAILYSMIRDLKPKRIIEVGSGYSTILAAKALEANGGGELVCIEPYPMDFLSEIRGISEIVAKPVQEIPVEFFQSLGEDDLLFIDSTHVSRVGSDVNHLFLRVLPALRAGVHVHVHDIFLPFEMGQDWVMNKKIFWNEQYLLQAFMLCNSDFVPTCTNWMLGREHADAMRAAFPCIPASYEPGGGSYYMKRVKVSS